MVYAWHKSHWMQLMGELDRLHHALLLTGPTGIGKLDFAMAIAQRLLCQQPGSDGFACGDCLACKWFLADNHPDFRRISPEYGGEKESPADATEAQSATAEQQKQGSRGILLDQVRALSQLVAVGAHQAGRRVILIHPAEAMNQHSANALLKLLEEPPASHYILLISNAVDRLLPTIRSRCHVVRLGKPEREQALEWLREAGLPSPDAALAAAGGMPLEAAKYAQPELAELFEWVVAELSKGRDIDPVAVASNWENRMRSRGIQQIAGMLPAVVGWLQKWLVDLIVCRMGAQPTYFGAAVDSLRRIAAGARQTDLFGYYDELLSLKRFCEHPLNGRLFMEDMMIRYSWSVSCEAAR